MPVGDSTVCDEQQSVDAARDIPGAAHLALLAASTVKLDHVVHAVVGAASRTRAMPDDDPASLEPPPPIAKPVYEPTAKFDAAALQKQHRVLEASRAEPVFVPWLEMGKPDRGAKTRLSVGHMIGVLLIAGLYIGAMVICYAWFRQTDLVRQGSPAIPVTSVSVIRNTLPASITASPKLPVAPPKSLRARDVRSVPVSNLLPVYVPGKRGQIGIHSLRPDESIFDVVMASGNVNASAGRVWAGLMAYPATRKHRAGASNVSPGFTAWKMPRSPFLPHLTSSLESLFMKPARVTDPIRK